MSREGCDDHPAQERLGLAYAQLHRQSRELTRYYSHFCSAQTRLLLDERKAGSVSNEMPRFTDALHGYVYDIQASLFQTGIVVPLSTREKHLYGGSTMTWEGSLETYRWYLCLVES